MRINKETNEVIMTIEEYNEFMNLLNESLVILKDSRGLVEHMLTNRL